MRRLALLFPILLATPAGAQTELTPESCEDTAAVVEALTRFTLNSANRIAGTSHQPLAEHAPRRIRDAAERAETSRLTLLEALHEYGDATDALAFRLRACGK